MRCNHYCLHNEQDGAALLVAAEKGHHECLSILLAHGAEVDKADRVSAVSVGDVEWRACVLEAASVCCR